YEMTTMLSGEERVAMRDAVLKDRQLWLIDLVSPYKDIYIDTQVVWHNGPYEAIIATVIAQKYDLVIKGTHQL
ncbi:universal stress protein UspE, partial [Pseudoalteromonas aliena]